MIESKIFEEGNIDIPNNNEYSNYILMSERQYCKLYRASRFGKYYIIKTTKDNTEYQKNILRREYTLSIGVTHPNIVHIYSYEEIPFLGEAIVMEYIEGQTLTQYLREHPTKQTLNKIFAELLSALSYLHKRNIIHNDITPDNILITRTDNTLKLIDFGLSDNDANYALKQLGCTPRYSSPELQEREQQIDARSDIYSIGVIMHDMFGTKYKSISARCTQKNPQLRYPDVASLQTAWQNRNQLRTLLLYIIVAIIVLLPSILLINKNIKEKRWEEEKTTTIAQIETELNQFYQVALDSIQNHAHFREFTTRIILSYWDKVQYQRKHKILTITNDELRTILDLLPLRQELGEKLVEESDKLPILMETSMSEDERQYYIQLWLNNKPYKPYK